MFKNAKFFFAAKTCSRLIISTLFVLLTLPAFAEISKENRMREAKLAVESFCKSEYDGDEIDQRIKLIKYSPTREMKEKERTGPALAWVVFWDWDPFFIVSSYNIMSLDLTGDRGTAKVEYKIVAESKGEGHFIVPQMEQDIVNLDLEYDGKQWWVIDPPLPKISIKAMIDLLEIDLHQISAWANGPSMEGRKIYNQKQAGLKMLKDLSK